MDEAYEQEVERADRALRRADFETALRHLQRAHVLAQRMTGRHTFIHWRMLVAGLRRGDVREVVGQCQPRSWPRSCSRACGCRAATAGGASNAFRPMPVPDDLRHLVP